MNDRNSGMLSDGVTSKMKRLMSEFNFFPTLYAYEYFRGDTMQL